MQDLKLVASINVVTDTEVGHIKIGDIEAGSFDDWWLEDHIRQHGPAKLHEALSHLNFQVRTAQLKVIQEQQNVTAVMSAIDQDFTLPIFEIRVGSSREYLVADTDREAERFYEKETGESLISMFTEEGDGIFEITHEDAAKIPVKTEEGENTTIFGLAKGLSHPALLATSEG